MKDLPGQRGGLFFFLPAAMASSRSVWPHCWALHKVQPIRVGKEAREAATGVLKQNPHVGVNMGSN